MALSVIKLLQIYHKVVISCKSQSMNRERQIDSRSVFVIWGMLSRTLEALGVLVMVRVEKIVVVLVA